jgi:predicted dehydrogenase
MKNKLAWGLLATGQIAHTFGRALKDSNTGTLLAVGSRTQAAADQFGDELKVPRRYGSYDALLADPDVQAVYISTPHPMHAEWAIKAADAGKHVLCEKPIAMNHPEALAIVEAARRNDVFLMEAFMYRCHPQTARLVELIREKAVGEVRVIQATFSFGGDFPLEGRVLDNAMGGGGILDVGCYCVSMARLVAGVAAGTDFAEPVEVRGTAHIGAASRVDEWAVASLEFPGGIVATLATGVQVWQENVVRIYGTKGYIFVPVPWVPGRESGPTRILVHEHGRKEPREIVIETDRPLFAIEADTVAENIDRRQAPPPSMTWDDTLGNMKTLDRWRESIGLVYDMERPDAGSPPVR